MIHIQWLLRVKDEKLLRNTGKDMFLSQHKCMLGALLGMFSLSLTIISEGKWLENFHHIQMSPSSFSTALNSQIFHWPGTGLLPTRARWNVHHWHSSQDSQFEPWFYSFHKTRLQHSSPEAGQPQCLLQISMADTGTECVGGNYSPFPFHSSSKWLYSFEG